MIGKYEVVVDSLRLQYKFTIERNITIIQGNSATGKTTLIDMIAAYESEGRDSGINVICEKQCKVLTNNNWKMNLSLIHDSIIFIDEGSHFITSNEFAEMAKNSDNYYVIATRVKLPNLPYSVKEIYEIKNKTVKKLNKYQGIKRLYSGFKLIRDLSKERGKVIIK